MKIIFLRQLFFDFIILFLVLCVGGCGVPNKIEALSSVETASSELASRVLGNNFTASDVIPYSLSTITLSYTDLDNNLASSCSIFDLSRVMELKPCSCDASGVCTVGVTNISGNSGAGAFKFNVISGGKTSTTGIASFTVVASSSPSAAPVTLNMTPNSFNEDTQSIITLYYTDASLVPATACTVSFLSNVTETKACSCNALGICTVGVTGTSNYNGSASFQFVVQSSGQSSNISSATFNIDAINDAPIMTGISSKATSTNTPLNGISFSISDVDSAVTCSSVVASSSNTTLIPNANIVISGTAPICFASITPALDKIGSTTISLLLTDLGAPLPALSVTTNFLLTVGNNPPTISFIADSSTNEDQSLNIDFTIDDTDSLPVMTCTSTNLSIFSSSNGTLIPGIAGTDVLFSGTYPNCRARFTPATNQNGNSNIMIRVTDGGAASTNSNIFVITVIPVNDVPVISVISDQTTNKNIATGPLAFTISDIDSAVTCSDVSASSSNALILPNANIVIAGTAPNCTATITPGLDQIGLVNITLLLTDLGTPLPAKNVSTTFSLTIIAVNTAPVISAITAQSTNKNIATTAILFTISDVDSVVTCSNVVGQSDDLTLVPNANIVIAGTAPNCTATITPGLDKIGSANILLTLTDLGTPLPAKTATSLFVLTVIAVNTAPLISAIPAQSTNEDTATSAIAFTISDSDSVIACSNVIGQSSNQAIVPNANIIIAGTAPNCTARITPGADKNGSVNISLVLTDLGSPLPAKTATSLFALSVNAVNDSPVMSVIADQTTGVSSPSAPISFTLSDVDSVVNCSSVTGVSSQTAIVPSANIVVSGTAPNCTAIITPLANQIGTSNITLSLTDTGTPLPGLSTSKTFLLTVANQPPTISFIANSTTNEDQVLNVDFIINDTDSTPTMSCTSTNLGILSSSNGLLIPGIAGSDVLFSGTYPNCRASFTPALNLNGNSNIIIRVTDGGASSTDSNIFIITVTPVNDAPVLLAISSQTTNKNTATTAIPFTISDVDSAVACSNVAGVSSDVAIVASANIVISGTAPNCNATITPALNQTGPVTITLTLTDVGTPLPAMTASTSFSLTINAINTPPVISAILAKSTNEDIVSSAIIFTISDADSVVACTNVVGISSDLTIVPNANIAIAGTAPNCTVTITPAANQNGPVDIVLTLTDLGTPLPAKTASTSFTLTVNAVNDTPVVALIADQVIEVNTSTPAISFTISDSDSAVTCSNLIATSADTAIIPNANIVIGGTAPNCTVTLTPASGKIGSSTITLTLTDLGTPLPALTAVSTFLLTVNPFNNPPVMSTLLAQSTNEDTASSAIAFTISDDTAVACSNVAAVSSNIAIVPNANIVITGTAPNCNAVITPALNQNGSLNITLTLTDLGAPLPAKKTSKTFALTVNAVNDVPIISPILAQSTDEDIATAAIPFTISDLESAVACSNVAGVSSNLTKVPNANIVIGGTAPNCTVTITPAANQNGVVNITLTLTDLGTPMPAATSTSTFALTIVPVPDLAGTLSMAGVASSYAVALAKSYTRSMNFKALTIDQTISGVDVCLSRDLNANSVLDASELCNVQPWLIITTALTPSPTGTSSGSTWPNYKIKEGTDGALFTASESPLKNSCSTTNTYFLSAKVIASNNRESNVISTSSWTFWEPTCLGTTVLAQWLDASEFTTISFTSSKVSAWADKSGNGRGVSQTSTTKQPGYTASSTLSTLGLNLAGVDFSATNTSYLTRAGFAYDFTSSSYFAVIKGTATSNMSKYIFSEGDANGDKNIYSPLAVSSSGANLTMQLINGQGTILLNKPNLSLIFFNDTTRLILSEDNRTSFYSYSNGVSQSAAASSYTRAIGDVNDYYCLGAQYINNVAGQYFTGTIGEFIITNGLLTPTNRQKLEGYSAHKWGVTTNLPVGHPHIASPPP